MQGAAFDISPALFYTNTQCKTGKEVIHPMQKQLTQGPVMPTMLRFAVPMILGDLLQQCYNIADTLIVGRFIGTGALAAVG